VIDLAESFDDGLRGIGWSGENFQHAQAAIGFVSPDTICKGAASVDGYTKWVGAARHEVEFGDLP
jgi:hypothetical protein